MLHVVTEHHDISASVPHRIVSIPHHSAQTVVPSCWKYHAAACETKPWGSSAEGWPGVQQHSKNLGAVVDIVVSHHAAPLKAQLVGQILSALVLPAPESYRPLLRRLACLGMLTMHMQEYSHGLAIIASCLGVQTSSAARRVQSCRHAQQLAVRPVSVCRLPRLLVMCPGCCRQPSGWAVAGALFTI